MGILDSGLGFHGSGHRDGRYHERKAAVFVGGPEHGKVHIIEGRYHEVPVARSANCGPITDPSASIGIITMTYEPMRFVVKGRPVTVFAPRGSYPPDIKRLVETLHPDLLWEAK